MQGRDKGAECGIEAENLGSKRYHGGYIEKFEKKYLHCYWRCSKITLAVTRQTMKWEIAILRNRELPWRMSDS
jgi:hypothetical protein